MKNRFLIIILLIVVLSAVFYALYSKNEKGIADDYKTVRSFDKSLIVPSDVVVIRKSDGFYPPEITIKKGTRVVWVNKSGRPFWPASDLHPTHELYSEFDPKEPILDGQAWAFTFERAGTWSYHDHLRPNKRGVIKVIVEP